MELNLTDGINDLCPSARVFATRNLDVRKAPDSPARLGGETPNRTGGETVTAISKRALELALPRSADINQTAAKIT